jgi:hypothetical protein
VLSGFSWTQLEDSVTRLPQLSRVTLPARSYDSAEDFYSTQGTDNDIASFSGNLVVEKHLGGSWNMSFGCNTPIERIRKRLQSAAA